jgi:hypothetical protein
MTHSFFGARGPLRRAEESDVGGSNSTARWDIPFPRPGCTLDVQIKCSNCAREMATCLADWALAPFVEMVKMLGDEIEPAVKPNAGRERSK